LESQDSLDFIPASKAGHYAGFAGFPTSADRLLDWWVKKMTNKSV